eukprot:tig00000681_g3143.t1
MPTTEVWFSGLPEGRVTVLSFDVGIRNLARRTRSSVAASIAELEAARVAPDAMRSTGPHPVGRLHVLDVLSHGRPFPAEELDLRRGIEGVRVRAAPPRREPPRRVLEPQAVAEAPPDAHALERDGEEELVEGQLVQVRAMQQQERESSVGAPRRGPGAGGGTAKGSAAAAAPLSSGSEDGGEGSGEEGSGAGEK